MRILAKSLFCLIFALSFVGVAQADVPHLLNFQGYLVDDQGPVTGDYEATFRIYDAPENGNILWEETDSVNVENGLYSLIFGESVPVDISWVGDRWIGIQFSGHPEMTPRYRQTAMPYSYLSEYADSSGTVADDAVTSVKILDGTVQPEDLSYTPVSRPLTPGISTAEIADDAVSSAKILNGTIQSEDLSYTPLARPLSPGVSTVEIANDAVTTVKILDGTILFGDIGQNGAAPSQVMKWNGSNWVPANDESGSGGDSDWVIAGNNQYSGVTGNVGIGNSSPAEKLDVDGNLIISGKATIGPGNNNTGAGAFVAGSNNTASGQYSSTSGGIQNTASGFAASVGGGISNAASGNAASVVSGQGNTASGDAASVGGGQNNYAVGNYSAVGGGQIDSANGHYSFVGGGQRNTANGIRSAIAGGLDNRALGTYSTIGGGNGNISVSTGSTVGGGSQNTASLSNTTIAGGANNFAGGGVSSIGGGFQNTAIGQNAVVSGGSSNYANGYTSTIGGGYQDTVFAPYGGISGGRRNIAGDAAGDTAAFVGGGWENSAINKFAAVGGGKTNTASGTYSAVSGGWGNTATGHASVTSGGQSNDVTGNYSFIGGGFANEASGAYASVGGGYQITNNANYSTVGGGYQNTASANVGVVSGGSFNTASAYGASVGGGRDNIASGFGATIPGGDSNSASGDYSFAAGKHAEANHSNSFVWSDGTLSNFPSTGNRQFLVQAGGGVGIGTNSPTAALDVQGTIKSRSGGYEFPDGTVQTTASISAPIGGIVAWLKSFPNTPALPSEYRECDGALISDPESPYNGQYTPALNSPSKFLISSNASGATGGSIDHTHTVTMGGNVVVNAPPTGWAVPPGTYNTDSALNLPPYYTVVWVMRIK